MESLVVSELYELVRALEYRCSVTGDYPETLTDGMAYRGIYNNGADPFGQPFSYRKLRRGYELFSNARDGIPYSEDDLVVSRDSNHCRLGMGVRGRGHGKNPVPPDPRLVAADAIQTLDRRVRDYLRYDGRYPISMAELHRSYKCREKCVAYGDLHWDPWGQRYVYRRTRSGYELFSKGPDRIAHTADDITPGWLPEECANKVSTGTAPTRVRHPTDDTFGLRRFAEGSLVANGTVFVIASGDRSIDCMLGSGIGVATPSLIPGHRCSLPESWLD